MIHLLAHCCMVCYHHWYRKDKCSILRVSWLSCLCFSTFWGVPFINGTLPHVWLTGIVRPRKNHWRSGRVRPVVCGVAEVWMCFMVFSSLSTQKMAHISVFLFKCEANQIKEANGNWRYFTYKSWSYCTLLNLYLVLGPTLYGLWTSTCICSQKISFWISGYEHVLFCHELPTREREKTFWGAMNQTLGVG